MVQCCAKPDVEIYYFSPAAFRGKCKNCKTDIYNPCPQFPLKIITTNPAKVYKGDEGLISRIHELEGILEANEVDYT